MSRPTQKQYVQIPKTQAAELCVLPADNQLGLNGTGMIIVNPPWKFSDTAFTTLQWLKKALTDHPQSSMNVEWLTGEAEAAPKKTPMDKFAE